MKFDVMFGIATLNLTLFFAVTALDPVTSLEAAETDLVCTDHFNPFRNRHAIEFTTGGEGVSLFTNGAAGRFAGRCWNSGGENGGSPFGFLLGRRLLFLTRLS